MRTIAHISDLHFGADLPQVTQGLLSDLNSRSPSLVVVSGDLTQRARRSQFAAARVFLDQLASPYLVVPGNHDVPLYNIARRFARPLARYQDVIQRELNPTYQDEELFVAGLNTARSLVWKAGRISLKQISDLQRRLASAGDRFKVVVTHHPFIPSPMTTGSAIDLGRAAQALQACEAAQVDLLLAGHLHQCYTGDTRAHFASAQRSILSVQAGTAVSHRVRHEPNTYNWITLAPASISVEVRTWTDSAFRESGTARFALRGTGWMVA